MIIIIYRFLSTFCLTHRIWKHHDYMSFGFFLLIRFVFALAECKCMVRHENVLHHVFIIQIDAYKFFAED